VVVKRPTAFIIMPFKEARPRNSAKSLYPTRRAEELAHLLEQLTDFLRQAGYEASRVSTSGNIPEAIVRRIHESDVTVAVLTGLNPNVMYELGIAHGLGKRTILLTEDLRELPFDLSSYNCLEYKYSAKALSTTERKKRSSLLKRNLYEALRRMDADTSATYGPVETYLKAGGVALTLVEIRQTKHRLSALKRELEDIRSQVQLRLRDFFAAFPSLFSGGPETYVFSVSDAATATIQHDRQLSSSELSRPSKSSWPCLDLLLAEDYVPMEYLRPAERETIYLLAHWARVCFTPSQSRENWFRDSCVLYVLVRELIEAVRLIQARLCGVPLADASATPTIGAAKMADLFTLDAFPLEAATWSRGEVFVVASDWMDDFLGTASRSSFLNNLPRTIN
jgi:nucleoside 2-deoxyribosyltransferase